MALPIRMGGGPMIGTDCRHRISVRWLTPNRSDASAVLNILMHVTISPSP